MAMAGLIVFARLVRRRLLKKRYIGILAYHHIARRPLGLLAPVATSPKVFSSHVSRLSLWFKVILMKDVSVLLDGADLSEDCMVFTFDDGYMDSFDAAAPILEENGVRGVFYMTAAAFSSRPFLWNDVVGEALISLRPHSVGDLGFQHQGLTNLLRKIAASQGKMKRRCIQEAFEFLLDQDQRFRDEICDRMHAFLGKNNIKMGAGSILMDPEQIHGLARRGHEIGAHTESHARLSRSGKLEKMEITESIRILRGNGMAVSSFAYPFGRETDIGPLSIDTVKQSGMANAVTMNENIVTHASNALLLPRIPVSPHHNASFIAARFEVWAWREAIMSLLGNWKKGSVSRKAVNLTS
jgi:peptidoglycan/xylan/chitin deacetylase (PgdA/CDA1 family)